MIGLSCGPESSRGPLLTRPLSVQVIPNKNEENRYFWECFVCFHFKYFITRLNVLIHTWVVSVWQEAALPLSLCSCLNQATHEFVSLSLLSAHKELILTLKSTTKQPSRFLTQHSQFTVPVNLSQGAYPSSTSTQTTFKPRTVVLWGSASCCTSPQWLQNQVIHWTNQRCKQVELKPSISYWLEIKPAAVRTAWTH